jgi:hypothetical protein
MNEDLPDSGRDPADGASASGNQPEPSATERRARPDRRQQDIPVAFDRRSGRDRRAEAGSQKPAVEKRRMVDPTTCERDYTEEEMEFLTAIDAYKRANRRPFPTWSEVLEVIRALGYRKVETPRPIPGVPVPVVRPPGGNNC